MFSEPQPRGFCAWTWRKQKSQHEIQKETQSYRKEGNIKFSAYLWFAETYNHICSGDWVANEPVWDVFQDAFCYSSVKADKNLERDFSFLKFP